MSIYIHVGTHNLQLRYLMSQ